MKIAVVTRRWSSRGGMEANVLALVRFLLSKGHELHVICQKQDVELAGVVVHPLWLPVLPESAKIAMFAYKAAQQVEQLACDVSFSSGHVFGVDVVRLEGGLSTEYRRQNPKARLDPAEWTVAAIEKRKLESAKLVLPLSDATAAALGREAHVPKERIFVVRNGVDLDHHRLPSEAQRQSARRAYQDAEPVIAFLGSGWERKGLSSLIHAVAQTAELERARVLVAGEDRKRARYSALAQKLGVDLRMLGYVSDVRPVLWAADLVALPSAYDPYGLVALEALAAGVEVVVSRACGVSEVVPRSDQIVDDPEDHARLGAALRMAAARARETGSQLECRRAAERWPIDESFAAIEARLSAFAPK